MFNPFNFRVLALVATSLTLSVPAVAGKVRCQNNQGLVVEFEGVCPTGGWMMLGSVAGGSSPNLRFSNETLKGIRNYGNDQSTQQITNSLASGLNGLFGGRQNAPSNGGPNATQKKLDTIKLIDQMQREGSISPSQAEKLKSEVIGY